jgi:rhamnogalacturonyl hydrolase YesR
MTSNKHIFTKFLLVVVLIQLSCINALANKNDWYSTAIKVSEAQLKLAAKHYTPGQNPRSISPNGLIRYAHPRDWTCGFFPGSLWLMYELSGDKYFKKQAAKFTEALDTVQYFTHTHDLGFMLFCSYGNAYRLTKKKKYKNVLHTGANSLISRFNKNVGCIRSWDFGSWQFPVIVDNMMNLEFLLWTSASTKNSKYHKIAISHANKTLENHFRKDNSSYHVVNYDTITGKAIDFQTHQGYSDSSAWARGQAWGLYGYTSMYKETLDQNYLNQALKIADFIMKHPRMPKDKIPYWDFDAPNIPHAPRDASAAAVIASALLELSTLTKAGEVYFNYAEDILKNLSTDKYLAKAGSNAYFLLKHCTGNLPNNSEIDTTLNYADYYYLEALKRYGTIKEYK